MGNCTIYLICTVLTPLTPSQALETAISSLEMVFFVFWEKRSAENGSDVPALVSSPTKGPTLSSTAFPKRGPHADFQNPISVVPAGNFQRATDGELLQSHDRVRALPQEEVELVDFRAAGEIPLGHARQRLGGRDHRNAERVPRPNDARRHARQSPGVFELGPQITAGDDAVDRLDRLPRLDLGHDADGAKAALVEEAAQAQQVIDAPYEGQRDHVHVFLEQRIEVRTITRAERRYCELGLGQIDATLLQQATAQNPAANLTHAIAAQDVQMNIPLRQQNRLTGSHELG